MPFKFVLLTFFLLFATKSAQADGRLCAIGDLHGDFYHTCLALRLTGSMSYNGTWIGGTDRVVQLGDVIDKGPYGKMIMELLRNLTVQAEAAGGQFVNLLGNHEIENLCGESPEREHLPEEISSYGGQDNRTAAFSHGGRQGDYLRGLKAVHVTQGTFFVHGGLLPKYAHYSPDEINQMIQRAIQNDNWTHPLVVPKGDGPVCGHGQAKTILETGDCSTVHESLRLLGLDRFIVGHSVLRSPSTIRHYCGGRWIMIDTMISRWEEMDVAYRGHVSAVELLPDGNVKDLYVTERVEDLVLWQPLLEQYGVPLVEPLPNNFYPRRGTHTHVRTVVSVVVCGVVIVISIVWYWVYRRYRGFHQIAQTSTDVPLSPEEHELDEVGQDSVGITIDETDEKSQLAKLSPRVATTSAARPHTPSQEELDA